MIFRLLFLVFPLFDGTSFLCVRFGRGLTGYKTQTSKKKKSYDPRLIPPSFHEILNPTRVAVVMTTVPLTVLYINEKLPGRVLYVPIDPKVPPGFFFL
jgi:hypothetical protein